jgi:hypothetical protein
MKTATSIAKELRAEVDRLERDAMRLVEDARTLREVADVLDEPIGADSPPKQEVASK